MGKFDGILICSDWDGTLFYNGGISEENIKAIKDRINSKWDLNREIDKLQRFTKRNAEEYKTNKSGVVLSRWEYENLQREQKRLNARLLREIERYGFFKIMLSLVALSEI